jgi:hypothetical protein
MKKMLYTLLYLVTFSTVSWTREERIIELKSDASSIKVAKVPFNSVVILDNRMDTVKLGLAQQGDFNKIVPVGFNKHASIAISEYILSTVNHLQTEPQNLLVILKKLMSFENIYIYM